MSEEGFAQLLSHYYKQLANPATRWSIDADGRIQSRDLGHWADALRSSARKTACAILSLPTSLIARDIRQLLARAVLAQCEALFWRAPCRAEFSSRDTFIEARHEANKHVMTTQCARAVILHNGGYLFHLPHNTDTIRIHDLHDEIDANLTLTLLIILPIAGSPGSTLMRWIRCLEPGRSRLLCDDTIKEIEFT